MFSKQPAKNEPAVTSPIETLFLLGTSHMNAPLDWLERLAVRVDGKPEFDGSPDCPGLLKECLLLKTCNRVELYGVASGNVGRDRIEDLFAGYYGIDRRDLVEYCHFEKGPGVIRHLLKVSAGLDSQIIGETEILGQVKESYRRAIGRRSIGPVLHHLFQKSFQVAKWIRSRTELGRGHVTIGSVATELAKCVFGKLDSCRALVIGCGRVGAKTAKALHSHGVKSITISSPTFQRAEDLANEVEGAALAYDAWAASLEHFDVVIFCTSANETILRRDMAEKAIKRRQEKPLFVVDLAIPRNVETSVAEIPVVFLFDLKDLAKIAIDNMCSRKHETKRCNTEIDARSQRLWGTLINWRLSSFCRKPGTVRRSCRGYPRRAILDPTNAQILAALTVSN